mmetsp:Transcript_29208/g.53444  ORF Transcript_29208/g.53444 Transcript_29208/m.53444 type:complete len:204 (-) Transcript_29208:795-1406(-)
MNFAATSALDDPTSFSRNRNCRLRLVTSIVSKSITSTFAIPDIAKSFNSSQPRPPAPTTRTRASDSCDLIRSPALEAPVTSTGSNSPIARAPVSLGNGDGRLRRVSRDPLLPSTPEGRVIFTCVIECAGSCSISDAGLLVIVFRSCEGEKKLCVFSRTIGRSCCLWRVRSRQENGSSIPCATYEDTRNLVQYTVVCSIFFNSM